MTWIIMKKCAWLTFILNLQFSVMGCMNKATGPHADLAANDVNVCTNRYKEDGYIKIIAKDVLTEKKVNMVISNTTFFVFLVHERGLAIYEAPAGRSMPTYPDPEAYRRFHEIGYEEYLLAHEGQYVAIDFKSLEQFLHSSHHGVASDEKKYLETMIFDRPITFEQLGVHDEKELIRRMFDFDAESGRGIIKNEFIQYPYDPAFIATLINLGYEVSDWIAPEIGVVLRIKKSCSNRKQ